MKKDKIPLIPLGDRVVVKPLAEKNKKLASGIILPESGNKEKPEQGTVVAVGPGKWDEDGEKRIKMSVKVGDTILFSKYSPDEVKIEDEEYLVVKEESILAIIK